MTIMRGTRWQWSGVHGGAKLTSYPENKREKEENPSMAHLQ
jgi:hypothetical protein